jgi:hypothetical protein
MDGLCTIARAMGAALGLAVASAAPAATVPITGGFMTVSATDPTGAWVLAGNQLTAFGNFTAGGLEWPVNYVFPAAAAPFGTAVSMGWFSDSADGWQGVLNRAGTSYFLTGSAVNESSWTLTAAPILVGHAGTYQEPFTFSGNLCGFATPTPMISCATSTDIVGAGTLDLVVGPDRSRPLGSFDIESVSYTFRSVPEPGSLALLISGLIGLRLRGRRSVC